MAYARFLAIPALALIGALTLPGPAPIANAPDGWTRLGAMPQELRSHLANQLKAFDLLSRDEKDSVRALDREIASEPEENRVAYYGVLRRYHLWVQSLPEAQRNELNAAPPASRFALVSKLVAEREGRDQPESSFFHYSDFGGVSPFDLAARIQVWLKLNDAQKSEVVKLAVPDRAKRMTQYVHEMKIQVPRPSESETEAIYQRSLESGRFPFLKKAEEKKKQSNLKHRFVDNYYFVEHPPAKVSPDNLLQFERALPVWLRNGFDTLPPEEARRRLTILYRLVYPRAEIEAVGKSLIAPAPPRPVSKPGATPPPPPTPAVPRRNAF